MPPTKIVVGDDTQCRERDGQVGDHEQDDDGCDRARHLKLGVIGVGLAVDAGHHRSRGRERDADDEVDPSGESDALQQPGALDEVAKRRLHRQSEAAGNRLRRSEQWIREPLPCQKGAVRGEEKDGGRDDDVFP
jgi:hypothetical protein